MVTQTSAWWRGFRFDRLKEIGEFGVFRDGRQDLTVLGFPDQNQFQACASARGLFKSGSTRRLALFNALDVAISVAIVVTFAPAILQSASIPDPVQNGEYDYEVIRAKISNAVIWFTPWVVYRLAGGAAELRWCNCYRRVSVKKSSLVWLGVDVCQLLVRSICLCINEDDEMADVDKAWALGAGIQSGDG